MLINTENKSTAVDGIMLPLVSRRVQIGWKSGSVSLYEIRKRDQFRFLLFCILDPQTVSYGGFANWCIDNDEWQFV